MLLYLVIYEDGAYTVVCIYTNRHHGPSYWENSTWKHMLVNKNFQIWLLIGWRLYRQPVRSHVWKYLLTSMHLFLFSVKHDLYYVKTHGSYQGLCCSPNTVLGISRYLLCPRRRCYPASTISASLIVCWYSRTSGPEVHSYCTGRPGDGGL